MGIEPTFAAWEAAVLPLDDTRGPTIMAVPSPRTQRTPMQILLNGETRRLDPPTTLARLLAEAGLAGRRVAIEVNGRIVPRGEYDRHALVEGDRVEIVHALGGG